MTAILSLDVGTTSLKGVLFDLRGNALAVELEEYDLHTPAPDIVECDPELYWQAAQKVIHSLLLKSRIEAHDIRSVGVTSQGETLVVLDDAGRPLRPAIVWLDNRSHAEAKEIEQHFGVEEVYQVTGQPELTPTWTATKILWLRKHEPEVFWRARKFLLVEDYLLFRLTDRYFSDDAMNPSTLYFDIRKPLLVARDVEVSGHFRRTVARAEIFGTLRVRHFRPGGDCHGAVAEDDRYQRTHRPDCRRHWRGKPAARDSQ